MSEIRSRVAGFVGVGSIGRPMAERICQAGYQLVVYDKDEKARENLRGQAVIAASPKEVADVADIVFSCLPSADAHRAAVMGKGGLIEGSRMKLYVHTGTSGAPVIDELAQALSRKGIGCLDAPVTGGVPRARQGDLTVIASGDLESLELARPYLECFASKVVHVSARAGDAQRMKLINNFLSAANLAMACEALVLSDMAGFDPAVTLEVINSGSGQNSATLTKLPDYVVPRAFNRGGAMGLMFKDLQEVGDEAERLGVPTPLGDAVRACFSRALAHGAPTDDVTSIIRHMEAAVRS